MPSYLSAYGREPWVLAMASIQPCKGGTALSPLQGLNTGMPRNPGLTPWALLSRPYRAGWAGVQRVRHRPLENGWCRFERFTNQASGFAGGH